MGWGSQDLIGLPPAQPVRDEALPSLTIPAQPPKPTVLPKPCLHLSLFTLHSAGDLEAAVRG